MWAGWAGVRRKIRKPRKRRRVRRRVMGLERRRERAAMVEGGEGVGVPAGSGEYRRVLGRGGYWGVSRGGRVEWWLMRCWSAAKGGEEAGFRAVKLRAGG